MGKERRKEKERKEQNRNFDLGSFADTVLGFDHPEALHLLSK